MSFFQLPTSASISSNDFLSYLDALKDFGSSFKLWCMEMNAFASMTRIDTPTQAGGSGASTITTPTLTPTHIQVSSTVGSADAALGTFKFCIPRHDMLFNV